MKHAPGPWENDEGEITGKGGSHIATVSTIDDFPCLDADSMHPEQREDVENEMKGNAVLIAAAPDLLEALEAVVDPNRQYDDPDTWTMVHAAIAKAQGKTETV